MPSLFVIEGRDQGTLFELDRPTLTVGRDSSNGVQLHDTEVSRSHAGLRRDGDSYVLTDTKSSNGVFVNGKQVTEQVLSNGDQLQIGRTLLLYTGFSEPPPEDLAEKIDIVSRQRSGEDSHIVSSMGQQEGSALLDSNIHDGASPWLARARSNLQIMYRTALAVSHTLDIDQLLGRIMEMIFEWVEADRGCIMLKQSGTENLQPKVRRHREGFHADEKITISKTILDYVVEKNEGVLTSNARDDNRWDPAKSILQMGIREAICVPMQGRYDVVGVIYIDTSITPQQIIQRQGDARKFTEEHLKLMIAIAHQAALAVEDTSYYKAVVQAERMAAVGQTITTLSHHIKNILQGIRSGSYLIEMGLDDHDRISQEGEADPTALVEAAGTIRKGWEFVERNQEKITTLVLDMLTFSKEREPEHAASDLNEVTSDAVQLMQSRAEGLGVEIHWQPAGEMPQLMFDPEGIHRAILNVVTNAVDACEGVDNGRVDVATEYTPEDGCVRVTISDNGSGIESEDLENIFTIFVSRKGGRGTGLGLAVSQKILKEHGGEIRVESQIGEGSCFTLEIHAVFPGKDGQDNSPPGDGESGTGTAHHRRPQES